jgi:hypothetical protein
VNGAGKGGIDIGREYKRGLSSKSAPEGKDWTHWPSLPVSAYLVHHFTTPLLTASWP